jgi:hypothetical protein
VADPHDHGPATDNPLRFEQALAALRDRVPMTSDVFDQLDESEREFAFSVANVEQADVIASVFDAIEGAVENGTDFDTFKDAVGSQLEDSWGGEQPGRVETVFRANVMSAYNGGRFREMTAPAVADARPYWRFDVIEDSRLDDCPICKPCTDVVLPADHPWWRTHYPILHPNCRCIATALTEEEARAEGITRSPPSPPVPAGFGKAPSVTGSNWEPDSSDYEPAIAAVLDDKLDEAA